MAWGVRRLGRSCSVAPVVSTVHGNVRSGLSASAELLQRLLEAKRTLEVATELVRWWAALLEVRRCSR